MAVAFRSGVVAPALPLLVTAALWLLVLGYVCGAVNVSHAATAVITAAQPPYDRCDLSFDQLDARVHAEYARSSRRGGTLGLTTVAALCPASCVGGQSASSSTASAPPLVYGSFPYHNASFICAAAVHAGVITDRDGGGVFVSRFFRQDWSNASTQSIFPFGSHQGRLSNGVLSLDVPAAWHSAPAAANSWSYTVRGRGDFVHQRRSAPFPPRAGHLHLGEWGLINGPDFTRYFSPRVQLLMGGFNGSHYLNDVWASFALREDDDVGADVDWFRLADAPFSPRADMLWFPDHTTVTGSLGPNAWLNYSFYVVGGQVDHRCGAYEFGVCSDEVWRGVVHFEAFHQADGLRSLRVDWRPQLLGPSEPYTRMPATPRCGGSFFYLASDQRVYQSLPPIVLHGGQTSYVSDTCEAQPDYPLDSWVFNPNAVNVSYWARGADINYPPRRSSWAETGTLAFHIDNRMVVGGWRMRQHRYDQATGQAVMTQAEVYADVWDCVFNRRLLRGDLVISLRDCFFGFPTNNGTGPPYIPSATIPLPMAGLRVNDGPLHQAVGVRFGGWTSEAALQQWRTTRPEADFVQSANCSARSVNWAALAVNMTAIVRQLPIYTPAGVTVPFTDVIVSAQSLQADRGGLNTSYLVDEQELTQGSYWLGSDWVVGLAQLRPQLRYYPYTGSNVDMPQPFTAHRQPWAMALTPEDGSWEQPQAASSLNTSRPRLNFRLRRTGHTLSTAMHMYWVVSSNSNVGTPFEKEALTVVSGGRSGAAFYSDWMQMSEVRCLRPDDPSFREALGPVVLLDTTRGNDLFLFGSFPIAVQLTVACPQGFHLEPPSFDGQAHLTCAANGMWVDARMKIVRRCQRPLLSCPWPLEDRGLSSCSVPLPVIDRIQVKGATNKDNLTVVSVPVLAGSQLLLFGQYLLPPFRVTVGGQPCTNPTSQATSSVNSTQTVCDDVLGCRLYYTRLQCEMPLFFGSDVPLLVESLELAAVATSRSGAAVTLSSALPQVALLGIYNTANRTCKRSQSPVELYDCSPRTRFELVACAPRPGIGLVTPQAFLGSVTPLVQVGSPLLANLPSGTASCWRYLAYPRLASRLRFEFRHNLSNVASQETALVSFADCPVGASINSSALADPEALDLCIDCQPGLSTPGSGAATCLPCAPGSFTNASGSADGCLLCEPGSFANASGSTACARCPLNTWQTAAGQSACVSCLDTDYVVYNSPSGRAGPARCEACPSLATCRGDVISAVMGGYLIIDQPRGLVVSVPCSAFACVGSSLTSTRSSSSGSSAAAELVQGSDLPVLNSCGSGRLPAFDPSEQELADSGGHNVLCAQCVPGYSSINGRCIPCASPQAGFLLLFLLAVALLVYVVYRWPHELAGSGTFVIVAYFVQQSNLFLPVGTLPQLLAIVGANVLGDHPALVGQVSGLDAAAAGGAELSISVCVVPLTEVGRVLVGLFSPFVLLGALAAQALVNWALQLVSQSSRCPPETRLHRAAVWLLSVVFSGESTDDLAKEDDHAGDDESAAVQCQRPSASTGSAPVSAAAGALGLFRRYQPAAVRIALASYSTLAVTTLSVFPRQWVGEFGYRLTAYPTVDVASPQYRALWPLALSILCAVVIGLPLALLVFLWQHRRAHVATPPERAATASCAHSLFVQLTASYRTDCWFYAPLVLVRRLLVVTVLVLISGSPVWVWCTLLNWLLLLLHQRLQPFHRPLDNDNETLCLLSLAVQTTLLTLFSPPLLTGPQTALLLVVAVLPLLRIAAPALQRLARLLMQRCRRPSAPGAAQGSLSQPLLVDDQPMQPEHKEDYGL